jgi:haloalkane dehalogenase
VLLTHGEPSWSYLNRKLIPPLLAAGHRVVLFDQVGFGRSDKPSQEADYSYARHIAWNEDLLINHLDLTNVTALFQDWGGLLGLRVVANHPDRFARLLIANTFLPTGDVPSPVTSSGGPAMTEGFYGWKTFCHKSQLAGDGVAVLMGRGTAGPSNPGQGNGPGKIGPEEAAAYGAPFPDETYKAGARAFPELVPTPSDDATGRPQPLQSAENAVAWASVFTKWEKPLLTAFGETDKVMAGMDATWQTACPGAKGQAHTIIKGAGHFLQVCTRSSPGNP